MNITRQQQILSLIKRVISTELRELNHEKFHNAVVTDVMLSNDGRECRIWVDAPESTIDALEGEFRNQIQRAFMKKFARRVIPKLHFLKDNGEMERLDALLESTQQNDE